MKKTKTSDRAALTGDDLRSEYQFDYRKARPNRFADRVVREQLMVTLDPDVARVFTTAESVNSVLRALIAAMPRVSQEPPSDH
jgi:hypothetical protein